MLKGWVVVGAQGLGGGRCSRGVVAVVLKGWVAVVLKGWVVVGAQGLGGGRCSRAGWW